MQLNNYSIRYAYISLTFGIFFAIVCAYTFSEENRYLSRSALIFISFFLSIAAFIIYRLFKYRAKKFIELTQGQAIYHLVLSENEKISLANHTYNYLLHKNSSLFWVISTLSTIIFGIFIVFGEKEARVPMIMVLVLLISLLAFLAFFMPRYFRNAHLKGNGLVFIGKHSAYVNGFFHLWDFPLSRIEEAKIIKEPFSGIYIAYSYRNPHFKNYEELFIPIPKNENLRLIVDKILEK